MFCGFKKSWSTYVPIRGTSHVVSSRFVPSTLYWGKPHKNAPTTNGEPAECAKVKTFPRRCSLVTVALPCISDAG